MKTHAFFLIGSQRSGTTLLRLMLNAHPEVHCYDEERAYPILEGRSSPESEEQRPWMGYKVPIFTELFHEYASFREYRDVPLLFVTRPITQVVASMLSLSNFLPVQVRTSQQWLPDPHRHFRQFLAYAGLDADAFASWRQTALTRDQLVRFGGAFWLYKATSFARILRAGFRAMRVHYTDLVTDPEGTLREVGQFLGLPYHPDLLRHHTKSHSETRNGMCIGNTRADRAVDRASLTKYRSVLTQPEQELLEQIDAAYHLR